MGKPANRVTWSEFSTRLCRANDFPPSFHFALVAVNGRTRRQDALIGLKEEEPWFSLEPNTRLSFMLFVLWNEFIFYDKDQYELVLRDHKGCTLDEHLTLRRIRDMEGLECQEFTLQRGEREDFISNLSYEVGEALAGLSKDELYIAYPDCFVKAIVSYLYDNHEFDSVENAVSLYRRASAIRELLPEA